MSDQVYIFPQPKFPDEMLDYVIDWTGRLDTGEVIEGAVQVVATGGLVIEDTNTMNGVTTVWVSGGDAPNTNGTIQLLAHTNKSRRLGVNAIIEVISR